MSKSAENLKEYRINWVKNNIKGNTILDIGPIGGNGTFFAHMALKEVNPSSEIHAIDLVMNKRFSDATGTISIKGSVYKMPYKDNNFDAVFMGEVIEHLENPYKAIKEVSRVLAPKGTLFLSTPNVLRYQNIKRAIIGKNAKTKINNNPIAWHHYEYSFAELNSLLENSGLRLIEGKTMPIKIGDIVIKKELPILKNLGNYWFIKAIKE